MSVWVYDAQGQPVQVAEDEATRGLAGGQYRPARGQRYLVRDPDGGNFEIPAESLDDALAQGGTLTTPETVHHDATVHAAGEGFVEPAMAAVEGVNRGATMGLSDVAAEEYGGPAIAEQMAARREANPLLSGGGEAAGTIAPLFVPGAGEAEGAELVARGARAVSAPARVVAGVGDIAAGGARGVLRSIAGGAPTGALGRVVEAGVTHAARGAAEGALFGVGNATSEAALGPDHDFTADALIAHAGMGAMLGGASAGLLGAGGRLARDVSVVAVERIAPQLARGLSEGSLLSDFASSRAVKALGGSKAQVRDVMAAQGGIHGLGQELIDAGVMEGEGEGIQRLYGATHEQIAERLEPLVEQRGQRIGEILREIDAREPASAPDVARIREEVERVLAAHRGAPLGSAGDVVARVERELAPFFERYAPVEEAAGGPYRSVEAPGAIPETAEQARMRAYRDALVAGESHEDAVRAGLKAAKEAGTTSESLTATAAPRRRAVPEDTTATVVDRPRLTLEELHNIRRQLDDVAFRGTSPVNPSPIKAELQAVRGIFERAIEDGVSRGARGAEGAGLVSEYKAAKIGWLRMTLAKRMVDETLLREATNRTFSLTDHLLGGSALAGLLSGGLRPGALVMGLLTGTLNKFLRERGNQVLAAGMSRVAQMRALTRATDGVNAEVRAAARAAVGAGRTGRVVAPAREIVRTAARFTQAAYERRVRDVRSDVGDPAALTERISTSTAGLARVAPQAHARIALRAAAASQFLAQRIPVTDRLPEGTLQPQLVRPLVPQSEREKFLRYARAVDEPMTVVDDLKAGNLSVEGIETLKTLYPGLYGRVVAEVQSELTDRREEVPYSRRIQLGALLGVPTDPTMTPDYMAQVATTIATTPTEDPNLPPAMRGDSLNLKAETTPSLTSQLEA